MGCNIAQDAEPVQYGSRLRQSLSIKRMQEFGANHPAFKRLDQHDLIPDDELRHTALRRRLDQPADILDLTDWQKTKLRELKLSTIGDVLEAKESLFRTLHYVGDVRARKIRNAAMTAVIEYLSG
ncbi:hypothetical protein [Microbacterium aurum]|uniref:hypothetical protein n=1 Tax=Microbacterium aurum TaxID=36805 RepID=UPI0028EA6E98|nr:hypothetical protein [Microbacterium aurum]